MDHNAVIMFSITERGVRIQVGDGASYILPVSVARQSWVFSTVLGIGNLQCEVVAPLGYVEAWIRFMRDTPQARERQTDEYLVKAIEVRYRTNFALLVCHLVDPWQQR
jgi:hypothetical protein